MMARSWARWFWRRRSSPRPPWTTPARGSAPGRRRRLKQRAKALNKAADLLEAKRDEFMALLTREAGKTYDDGLSEVREAVDFCRFYANEAQRLFR